MTESHIRTLINGIDVETSANFPVYNPADGSLIATVPDAGPEDGLLALTAADEAAEAWAATSTRERSELLRRAYELMIEEREDFIRTMVRENGKSWRDAAEEVQYAAEFFRWFAEEAPRVRGDFREAPAGDKTIITAHRPVGPSLLITPWNFPAAMATRKIAPALAAGCTVILKPAAETPLTAIMVADMLRRAGVPKGVVNVVTTSRAGDVVSRLLDDARLRKLSFTGSTQIGSLLLKQAAAQVLSVSMELGGNAPFLVLEGSDLDAAVQSARAAKLRNGGAACIAANRFYVHESLVAQFTERLFTAFADIKVGPGLDQMNDLGSMVSAGERDKILSTVEEAVTEGATELISPSSGPSGGAFVSPIVLSGVQHGSSITAREVFGPVAPIIAVESTEEAIRAANDTPYGLISYVFASDQAKGIQVARQLEAGMVAVNRGSLSDPAAPFGGVKHSGLGREGGFHGIHEFLEPQYIATDL